MARVKIFFAAQESSNDVADIYQLLYHTDASRIEALIPVMQKYLTEDSGEDNPASPLRQARKGPASSPISVVVMGDDALIHTGMLSPIFEAYPEILNATFLELFGRDARMIEEVRLLSFPTQGRYKHAYRVVALRTNAGVIGEITADEEWARPAALEKERIAVYMRAWRGLRQGPAVSDSQKSLFILDPLHGNIAGGQLIDLDLISPCANAAYLMKEWWTIEDFKALEIEKAKIILGGVRLGLGGEADEFSRAAHDELARDDSPLSQKIVASIRKASSPVSRQTALKFNLGGMPARLIKTENRGGILKAMKKWSRPQKQRVYDFFYSPGFINKGLFAESSRVKLYYVEARDEIIAVRLAYLDQRVGTVWNLFVVEVDEGFLRKGLANLLTREFVKDHSDMDLIVQIRFLKRGFQEFLFSHGI